MIATPSLKRWLLGPALLAALLALPAFAAPAQKPDFTGAWRLDDRNSDSADSLTAAMRNEARNEQQAALPQNQTASGSGSSPGGAGNGGGHHGGGMGGGGMGGHGGGAGGGGMGGGGMGGHGGGGHGHHGGDDSSTSKKPDTDKDPIATATYPMPPMLKVDSVLLMQQDDKTFQVRLNDGSQLTGKLDGQARQSLSGNAMVRGHVENGQLHVSVQYADGTQLEQTWALSPDGQQMVVTGAWKVPTLQQPVTFKRTYVGLH
ncbi:hypothetical protein [Dyella amyloliquefaciens]|uniref:hypothetical protein n=1 Tax=Dyella amyloliquefaciens TaxID=1770545 RepID=UPI0013EEC7AF|nr:hypothetical protein [Dyella amyloliquefaciens]